MDEKKLSALISFRKAKGFRSVFLNVENLNKSVLIDINNVDVAFGCLKYTDEKTTGDSEIYIPLDKISYLCFIK